MKTCAARSDGRAHARDRGAGCRRPSRHPPRAARHFAHLSRARRPGAGGCARPARFRVPPRRVRRRGRTVRLRQEHALGDHRRAGAAERRCGRDGWARDHRHRGGGNRRRVPGGRDLRLAQRVGQCRIRSAPRRHRTGGDRSPGGLCARLYGPDRFPPRLSGPALRRHAPARLHCAHARAAAAPHPARRAVRCARSADPPAHGRGAAAAVARDRRHGHADHARARRGGAPLRPRGGDVGARRPLDRGGSDRQAAAARQRAGRRSRLRCAQRRPLGAAAGRIEKGAGRVMTRVRLIQLAVVCGAILVLELLCRLGIIDRFTMIPPSEMATALGHVVATAPWFWGDVGYTLGNLAAAIVLSVVGGFLIGLAVHAVPRLRRALDPIFTSYYSVPTFVLYPLLIVVFGIGPTSLIVLGALFGIVAMIVATVTAIDRVPSVLLKVARVSRLGRLRTALLMKLPAASPHLVTGLRLAVAYSVIGIIAGEFILSTEGIGRRVALAYNNFDNQTMYALLVLILGFAIVVNAVLGSFEQALHRRWYRS